MRGLRACLLRAWGVFRTQRSEGEFLEEMEAHLQMRTADHIRAGRKQLARETRQWDQTTTVIARLFARGKEVQ